MNDDTEALPPNDPEKAFNDLRSEVRVLRRAVEDWHEALKTAPPPNYEEQLIKIGNALRHIYDATKDIKNIPDDALQHLRDAGEQMFKQADRIVDDASSALASEERALRAYVADARHSYDQRRWLMWTAGGSFVLGMMLFYGLARALPWDGNTYIAASIIGEDRWNAGLELLRKSSPRNWNEIVADNEFMRANRSTFDACRAAAAKSKKDEKCTIIISPSPALNTE